MKANELRKSLLASGMDPAEAEAIVKGRVEAGGVEADEDTVTKSAANDELEMMEKAVSEVVESWDAEEVVEVEEEAVIEEEITKGSVDPDFAVEDETDVTEIIEEFAKAADSIADAVTSRYDGLAKAVKSSSSAVSALAKATWQLQEDLATVAQGMGEIQKALNMPVAPKSVSGTVEAVPATGEQPVVENVVNLREQIIAKAMTEIQDPETGIDRRQTLAKAMADVDAGGHLDRIAQIVGINKAS